MQFILSTVTINSLKFADTVHDGQQYSVLLKFGHGCVITSRENLSDAVMECIMPHHLLGKHMAPLCDEYICGGSCAMCIDWSDTLEVVVLGKKVILQLGPLLLPAFRQSQQ